MTPKEKAIELVEDYRLLFLSFGDYVSIGKCQQCALIVIDEIINSFPHTFGLNKEYTKSGELVTSIVNIRPNISYWQEVKNEIENL